MIRRLWIQRALLLTLIRRQYQLRYRQSFVGFVWALLPALGTVGVGAVLFDRVIGVDTGRTPYGVFALAALVPWTFFANSISMGVPSVISASSMVTRLAFPRAVLPLAAVGLSVIDFGVVGVAFVGVALLTGEGLPLTAFWAPLLLLIELPLVCGVVLLGSALNVFARDIKLGVPLLVQFWLILTPVMYPLNSVPAGIKSWYMANPMTGLVESFRMVLVRGEPPTIELLLPAAIGAVVMTFIGLWYFSVIEPRFADAI